MKRSFPPPAREVLCVLAGALACGVAACEPDNSVEPGPPVLLKFVIVEGGTTPTTITPDTPVCASGIVGGEACLPMGMVGSDVPPDGLCRQEAAMNWCRCNADPMDDTMGTWACPPFSAVTGVIAVFDRVLDTTPFDEAATGPLPDAFITQVTAGPSTVLTDYSPTGAADGLIFNLFGPFFGNFRADGPSLLAAPQPAFASGATVTMMVNGEKVRSKAGEQFTSTGQLTGGLLAFTMAPFSVAVVPPDIMGPDPVTVIVAFTNLVDAATLPAHITVTVNGAPAAFDVAQFDAGATFGVAPMGGGAWPAGATVVVSVDAAVVNLLDQPIAAAVTEMFTAAP
jgi:hypothetical protein